MVSDACQLSSWGIVCSRGLSQSQAAWGVGGATPAACWWCQLWGRQTAPFRSLLDPVAVPGRQVAAQSPWGGGCCSRWPRLPPGSPYVGVMGPVSGLVLRGGDPRRLFFQTSFHVSSHCPPPRSVLSSLRTPVPPKSSPSQGVHCHLPSAPTPKGNLGPCASTPAIQPTGVWLLNSSAIPPHLSTLTAAVPMPIIIDEQHLPPFPHFLTGLAFLG